MFDRFSPTWIPYIERSQNIEKAGSLIARSIATTTANDFFNEELINLSIAGIDIAKHPEIQSVDSSVTTETFCLVQGNQIFGTYMFPRSP